MSRAGGRVQPIEDENCPEEPLLAFPEWRGVKLLCAEEEVSK